MENATEQQVVLGSVVIVAAAILDAAAAISTHFYGASRYENLIFYCEMSFVAVLAIALMRGTRVILQGMRDRRGITTGAIESRRQVEQLFHMSDVLQSALGYADSNAVLQATASELLSGFGGALHIFNNSGDRLDLSTAWNWQADGQPCATISPTQCWALKRGKPHVNRGGGLGLRCEHHVSDTTVLEIPMMARGEVYGLLTVQALGPDAEEQLSDVSQIAGAIAEAMSLALSNIALREKLRTQALRDPLTGLYNRRYMEDVLERYASLAERNGSALSAIMIDLDHFKRLNDEHGHALGDAILREVAGALMGAIRPADVACRYGGEELVVLMPDCTLAEALIKAETLRARIESLSDNHGIRITASFGVATIPDCTERWSDLVANADAALYRAKQDGRNRVEAAPRRANSAPLSIVAAE